MSFSRTATIEHLARTVNAGQFDEQFKPEPYQRLVAAALGALGVLVVAAAFLASIA